MCVASSHCTLNTAFMQLCHAIASGVVAGGGSRWHRIADGLEGTVDENRQDIAIVRKIIPLLLRAFYQQEGMDCWRWLSLNAPAPPTKHWPWPLHFFPQHWWLIWICVLLGTVTLILRLFRANKAGSKIHGDLYISWVSSHLATQTSLSKPLKFLVYWLCQPWAKLMHANLPRRLAFVTLFPLHFHNFCCL